MDEPVFAEHYVRIWMTAPTVTEVVHQVARDLAVPITAGEVLLMAERLRREGMDLPTRPGQARSLRLVRQPDGDYRDRHGRRAYPVGEGTSIEGPWVCTECCRPMCGGFILLAADLQHHWPVCERCGDVAG
jgi:hypothetical protein